MRNRQLKLHHLIETAYAARTKTIAAGAMAWRWLRVHAPKNARIQATLHQAAGITRNALRGRIQGANRKLADILGDSKQPVAKRTVNQPTHVVNVSKSSLGHAYDGALLQAQAEMMARVHAEQQAIQRISQIFGERADSSLQEHADRPQAENGMGFVESILRFGVYPAAGQLAGQQGSQSNETLDRVSPIGDELELADTRPIAAPITWRPSGLRYMGPRGLSAVRRPLLKDLQCRAAGRRTETAGANEQEIRDLAVPRKQKQERPSREGKERPATGRRSTRKARANRR
jgi:hypothetical protein